MEWKSDTSFCWFSCLLSRVALIEMQFTFMESSDLSRGICRAGAGHSVENAKPPRFIKCWEMSKKSKPSVGDFIGLLIHRLIFCTITDLRQANVANFLKHRGEIHIFSIWFEKHVQVLPNHCCKPTHSFLKLNNASFKCHSLLLLYWFSQMLEVWISLIVLQILIVYCFLIVLEVGSMAFW